MSSGSENLSQENPLQEPVVEHSGVASRSTFSALEFNSSLAVVASFASSDLGAARVRALEPAADRATLESRRRLAREVDRLMLEGVLVPAGGEPILPVFAALFGEDGVAGRDLLRVGLVLRSVEAIRRRVATATVPCPELAASLLGVPDGTELARRIETTLDARGEVRDDASSELVSLRRAIRGHRDRLYQDLSVQVGRLREHLSEETIPLRNNRLVLVLDAGSRGRVPGLVHGRSASGKSFYFEPLETVETNNQLQQSLEDESAERRRVLAELLAEVVHAADVVEAHAHALAEVDAAQAAVRFAQVCGGHWVECATTRDLELVAARHPLLDPRLAEARQAALGHAGHEGAVVGLDVVLEPSRRILVLTGPNAGGKTVALKTVGLVALLHHCGLPVPAAARSRIPWFGRFVATVGDDQDLLADRSTFSGRLLRLQEAWEQAQNETLVLLDELGSGTDPEEGAALSIALLEHLLARGATGLITTHLTQLAAAALELPGAACGAMEFSPDTGRPTFRLVIGPPGGSEAIALARRLGLDAAWVERAEALLGDEQRDFRRLLAEVEAARDELGRSRERFETEASDLAKIRERLDRERAALEAERKVTGSRLKRELDEFRRETARKLSAEVERLREEFRSGRRQKLASEGVERLFSDAPRVEETEEAAGGPLEIGGAVRHRTLGWSGTLAKLDGDRVEVLVGGKRLRGRAADLVVERAGESIAAQRPAGRGQPEDSAEAGEASELHLIGMRVEEALDVLDGFLDRSLRGHRREVRVVHGHGTGRLRDALRQHLRRHPAVASHRAGEPNEGGNGATVVELRGA